MDTKTIPIKAAGQVVRLGSSGLPRPLEKAMTMQIRFDGPPGPRDESGRFIEVENEKGEGISAGEWVQDGEDWLLKIREFPMQDGPDIPWFLAEEIYTIYSRLYGHDQSLERLAERGGFGWSEIPHFIDKYKKRGYIDVAHE